MNFETKEYLKSRQRAGLKKSQAKIEPALLTIVQVCQLLNISRPEYYRLNSTGKIAPLPVPLCGKVLYNRTEIERWIEAGCVHRKVWQDMKNS